MSEELQAGRDLDALVAERVMGYEKRAESEWLGGFAWISHDDGHWYGVTSMPRFSTDISAAWDVVERLQSDALSLGWKRRDFSLERKDRMVDGRWYCVTDAVPTDIYPNGYAVDGVADTAPLAICRAALKACAPTPEQHAVQKENDE